MKNYANKFPLPTGNIWSRLPERVSAIETDRKSILFYRANLTQTGTTAPVATIQRNTTGATITLSYSSTGTYVVTSDKAIFTSGKTSVMLGLGANKLLPTAVVNSTTQITITTSNASAALADALLAGNLLTIEIFN